MPDEPLGYSPASPLKEYGTNTIFDSWRPAARRLVKWKPLI
jgi:hypothetical protein